MEQQRAMLLSYARDIQTLVLRAVQEQIEFVHHVNACMMEAIADVLGPHVVMPIEESEPGAPSTPQTAEPEAPSAVHYAHESSNDDHHVSL